MKTIALSGVGYWGPYLLRNLMNIPGFRVKTICDINSSHLEKSLQQYPLLQHTHSFEDIVSDPEIEAVIIATPASLHYSQTKACLMAGKSAMVEKPLTLNLAHAEHLASLAQDFNCVLMVGHTFLYNAAVLRLRELLCNNELGTPYFILSQRMSLGRVRDDVNVLWNLAPHDYSILLYLLQRMPEWIMASGAQYLHKGNEDVVFATLGYADGVLANVQVNWLNPIKVRQMLIVGSRRMVIYDDVSQNSKLTLYDNSIEVEHLEKPTPAATFSEFQTKVKRGSVNVLPLDFQEPLHVEMEHFLECLEGRKRPLTDASHAIRVIRMLEATQRSISSGKKEMV